MASVRAFLLATALHLHASTAVTVSPEKESVVRREPHRVELDVRGEIHDIGDKQNPFEAEVAITEQLEHAADEMDKIVNEERLATMYCDYDFPLGAEGDRDCSGEHVQGGHVSAILQRTMCQEAAIQSGANHTHAGFDVPLQTNDRWEYKHPKGCFKDSCGNFSSDPVCYFFNGGGNEPDATVTGQIVCSRPKHDLGTENQTDTCPDGYQVIDDESTCEEAAVCMGFTPGQQFIIGENTHAFNSSDYMRGCMFIEVENVREVYYNPASASNSGSKGTNLCNVTSQTHWGAAAGTSAGVADTTGAAGGNTSLMQAKNIKAHA